MKALTGGKAEFTQTDEGITIALPKKNQDDIATVIELEVDGDAFSINPMEITAKPSKS